MVDAQIHYAWIHVALASVASCTSQRQGREERFIFGRIWDFIYAYNYRRRRNSSSLATILYRPGYRDLRHFLFYFS